MKIVARQIFPCHPLDELAYSNAECACGNSL
jgi:hypothetical protein